MVDINKFKNKLTMLGRLKEIKDWKENLRVESIQTGKHLVLIMEYFDFYILTYVGNGGYMFCNLHGNQGLTGKHPSIKSLMESVEDEDVLIYEYTTPHFQNYINRTFKFGLNKDSSFAFIKATIGAKLKIDSPRHKISEIHNQIEREVGEFRYEQFDKWIKTFPETHSTIYRNF